MSITEEKLKISKPINKPKRISKLYGNCQVYSPQGNLMFLCLEKKAKWYLDRDLAYKIHEPITNVKWFDSLLYYFKIKKDKVLKIKLKFEPKSEGNKDDLYSLSIKENRCVVTGEDNVFDLTKHHIVPHCYRKHMPEHYKSANSHDIVPLCIEKHLEYEEKYATKLKNRIGDEYGVPLNGILSITDEKHSKAYRSANALKVGGDKIPEERKNFLLKEIQEYLSKENITDEDINDILKVKPGFYTKEKDHAETVIKTILEKEGEEGLEEFIKMWRKDFIDNMNPSYMPKYWDINRPGRRLN